MCSFLKRYCKKSILMEAKTRGCKYCVLVENFFCDQGVSPFFVIIRLLSVCFLTSLDMYEWNASYCFTDLWNLKHIYFFPFHLFICLFHHVHEGVYSVMVFKFILNANKHFFLTVTSGKPNLRDQIAEGQI